MIAVIGLCVCVCSCVWNQSDRFSESL